MLHFSLQGAVTLLYAIFLGLVMLVWLGVVFNVRWRKTSVFARSKPSASAAQRGPAAHPLHFDLNGAQAKALAQLLTDDTQAGIDACLSVASGHSGFGLYAHQADFPDEGAIFVAPLVEPVEAHA